VEKTNKQIIRKLEKSKFNPLFNDPKLIPNAPGIYVLCVKKNWKLPLKMRGLKYHKLNGLPVVYVGKSNSSLRNRDYGTHFNGTARGSTLRKSLGVLFGLKKEPMKGRYRFIKSHEDWLTKWMKQYLTLHFLELDNPTETEKLLINLLNPPLNIQLNKNPENAEFRNQLSAMRTL
jgi:hypothetical protein